MLKVIRHRPVQAAVIAALAALVTACAVFTPLYQRAVDQAAVTVALDHAPASASQLRLTSNGILPDKYSGREDAVPPLTAEEMAALVPSSLRRHFEAPVAATSVTLDAEPDGAVASRGPLLWRAGACRHLELVSGRCPAAAGDVAVSSADAANFGWGPGARIPVAEVLPKGTPGVATTSTVTVSGVYRRPTSRYWDGWALTGASGSEPDLQNVAHDTWLTGEATLSGTPWRNPVTQLDLPLDRRTTGVDELLTLGPAASAFQHTQSRRSGDVASVRVRTDLAALTAQVRHGRSQARATVPMLMLPLGLLGLVVLWMALGAAADQRRPEVALVRLRGRGTRGARAHLLRELLTVALAGVPLGALVALGLGWLARHRVLPGRPPFEVRADVWAAVVLALVAVSATTVLVAAAVSRQPIGALLRRVPARRPGWALGTTDAIVLTAAGGIVAAFATGRLTGPLALSAPVVLALALGLVLARVVTPVATGAGRRLLRRGRPRGVALLQAARRPGTRGVVVLLTVSAAILVFAGNAVAIGTRNRSLAAAQDVGAPMVASLGGGTPAVVADALRSAGAPPRLVTPVVVQPATGNDTQTNLFADPAAFARIASLPSSARAAIGRLHAPPGAPVTVRGNDLTLQVDAESLRTDGQAADLGVRLLRPDGTVQALPLGSLPPGSGHREVHVRVACPTGCALTGWEVTAAPASTVRGGFTLSDVRIDGHPLELGTAADWADATGGKDPGLRVEHAADASLGISIDSAGHSELLLTHRWVPATLPAVVAGSLPGVEGGPRFAGTGLDGTDRPMRVAARVDWLPQTGQNASLSDLALAVRSGGVPAQGAELQVWFGREDTALLNRVTDALEARHVPVLQVRRESEAVTALEESPAAWSLGLGVLVGVACLLVAVLGLLVAGTASWARRARDLAVIRLNGLPPAQARRIALGEQLPVVVAAGLSGTLSGLLAAHFSLPALPILPSAPPVDLLDLSTAWGPVALLSAVPVLVLCVLAWGLGSLVARRASFDRIGGAS